MEVVRHLGEFAEDWQEAAPGLIDSGFRPSTSATFFVPERFELRFATTDARGRYEVAGLVAARYSVRLTGRDRRRVVDRLELDVGGALTVDAALGPRDEIPPATFQVAAKAEEDAPPCWYALGGDVYHQGDAESVVRSILSFGADPHWFEFFEGARPESIEAVRTERHGARLGLTVRPLEEDPRLLRLTLTLAGGTRGLYREIEHRHTNVLPFLFALRTGGRNVTSTDPGTSSRWGGMSGRVRLVNPGAERRWELVVTASSLERLLPGPLPERVEIVAAFAERQHESLPFLRSFRRFGQGDERGTPAEPRAHEDRVLRSPILTLVRRDGTWRSVE